MIDKSKTLTVGELLAILADGRISPDMPIVILDEGLGCLRGVPAVEIITMKDGSRALTVAQYDTCGQTDDIESTSEVFP